LIPLLSTLAFFLLFAKDSPDQPAPRPLSAYADVFKLGDTWWFCLLYAITFGGFVGLASFLNVFFLSQYGLARVEAGNFATLCVIAGSGLRPVGGYLADRFGGIRMLTGLYLAVGATMLGLCSPGQCCCSWSWRRSAWATGPCSSSSRSASPGRSA
jgi:NNP family nitrate/nitrite transporter-like MFS transporter